jgi:hypothetical protein
MADFGEERRRRYLSKVVTFRGVGGLLITCENVPRGGSGNSVQPEERCNWDGAASARSLRRTRCADTSARRPAACSPFPQPTRTKDRNNFFHLGREPAAKIRQRHDFGESSRKKGRALIKYGTETSIATERTGRGFHDRKIAPVGDVHPLCRRTRTREHGALVRWRSDSGQKAEDQRSQYRPSADTIYLTISSLPKPCKRS